jgi:hypothetical protein
MDSLRETQERLPIVLQVGVGEASQRLLESYMDGRVRFLDGQQG